LEPIEPPSISLAKCFKDAVEANPDESLPPLDDPVRSEQAAMHLLTPENISMWWEHQQSVKVNRKQGAQKAAVTRRKKKDAADAAAHVTAAAAETMQLRTERDRQAAALEQQSQVISRLTEVHQNFMAPQMAQYQAPQHRMINITCTSCSCHFHTSISTRLVRCPSCSLLMEISVH
jgi:hypothetical protein